MFKKLLIANRGEIACRIARSCRKLGIRTVAVHSEADRDALHVEAADEAFLLGPAPVRESYLNIQALKRAIFESGADAVHPGYGLLSENADFAEAVAASRATFVGPSPEALRLLGDKLEARRLALSVGVAPPPGSSAARAPGDPELLAEAKKLGFPVLVKGVGGGGGIGMGRVDEPDKLHDVAQACSGRSQAAFGDPRIYIERYLERPRHIEVQVFRDAYGNTNSYGDRECSVQRRHQKILEEALSRASFLEASERRKALWDSAVRIIDKADYQGAATVEFVADVSGAFYFLEVNARLQVEHPVTEAISGLDLVELQLRVAAGEALGSSLGLESISGHALEARLYAEDPARGFLPQPGTVDQFEVPEMEGLRVDAGVRTGSVVTPYYDPLLAKVIAHGSDRNQAITRLAAGLRATKLQISGPKRPRQDNRKFLIQILESDAFGSGEYDTSLADAVLALPSRS